MKKFGKYYKDHGSLGLVRLFYFQGGDLKSSLKQY